MQLRLRPMGPVAVLDLEGRLVLGDGDDQLKKSIQNLVAQGTRSFLLNMEKITFMDTGGILSLLTSYKRAVEAGGSLKLLKPTRKSVEILTICGLTKVINIFQDEAEALRSF